MTARLIIFQKHTR